MIFEHCNYLGDLELTKKETNGIRLYNLPSGDWVPSITSVTSFYSVYVIYLIQIWFGMNEHKLGQRSKFIPVYFFIQHV